MATKKNKEDRFEQIGSKIDPAMAEVLDACCNALEVDIYHLIQWFCYVIVKASAPMHALDPRIQKLMAMMESDVGWQKAFNIANPDGLDVAQVILILEQQNHRGFGCVMIDKPFCGEPQRQTECVDDILERVTEVTMRGIYKRLRLMGAKMQCQNLTDVLRRSGLHRLCGGRRKRRATDGRYCSQRQGSRLRQTNEAQETLLARYDARDRQPI